MNKPYNNGRWSQARFNSFVKSALRNASLRWPPKTEVRQEARVKRGVYRCTGYKRKAHEVPATLPPPPGKKQRIQNAVVDHIQPVVDPKKGFQGWDELIARLFCERDGLQLLCNQCHSKKTAHEKETKKNA